MHLFPLAERWHDLWTSMKWLLSSTVLIEWYKATWWNPSTPRPHLKTTQRPPLRLRSAHRWLTIQFHFLVNWLLIPACLKNKPVLWVKKDWEGIAWSRRNSSFCTIVDMETWFWRPRTFDGRRAFFVRGTTKPGPLNGAVAEWIRHPTILKIIGGSHNRFSHSLIGRNVKSPGIAASQELRL
jgi:hypothetical protein